MSLRDHPDVCRFVKTAKSFCKLIESPVDDKHRWVRKVLRCLAAVYASVLRLPRIAIEEFDKVPETFDRSHRAWQTLYNRLGAALGEARLYWAYFDPTEPADTQEQAIVGDLADDLTDIYLDIKPGLCAWDSGIEAYLPEVVWDWREVLFQSHWGVHAVDAMRALHRLVFLRGLPNA